MDAVELEKYEYQLAQIKLALVKDPTNVEYLNLAEELASLISLTREYLASTAPPAAAARASGSSAGTTGLRPPRAGPSGTPTHVFKAGDDCLARYSADQKFYPARITSIGGAAENLVFSVIFQGYDSTELVQRADVKALSESSKKRQMVMVVEDDAEKDKKRKKNEKKAETRAEQTAAQGSKQKSWQSFAKKGAKKGVHIPGIAGDSMFRSPEDLNPNARVGVVGSGKGMTAIAKQARQTFREALD